jgi:hypothetical protein
MYEQELLSYSDPLKSPLLRFASTEAMARLRTIAVRVVEKLEWEKTREEIFAHMRLFEQ